MSNTRFCVFCGKKPEDKNKEHILPQWLLELTGDPKRVVNFGTNYKSGKTLRYDWSNFVVPSCSKCNSEYSDMEDRAKGYVERLLKRKALNSSEYFDFMDWMDKVRIGVWLAYHYIQGNPTNITPMFHINTRISKKDRMIAIYPIANQEIGLNVFGVETHIFHRSPNCFGLKINNILIINISNDFLFSARCGFPFPRKSETWLDGENAHMTSLDDFCINHKIQHPLIRKKIIKPSIHLYQPIMQEDKGGAFQSGYIGDFSKFDSYIAQHTIPPYPSGKGILFNQKPGGIEPIYDLDTPISFENIKGIHSKPIHEIVKQVYEFQSYIYKSHKYTANDPALVVEQKKLNKMLLKENSRVISYWNSIANKHA